MRANNTGKWEGEEDDGTRTHANGKVVNVMVRKMDAEKFDSRSKGCKRVVFRLKF